MRKHRRPQKEHHLMLTNLLEVVSSDYMGTKLRAFDTPDCMKINLLKKHKQTLQKLFE